MRPAGFVLVFLGIVMLIVGTFNGCGSLFTWNGKHAIATVPLPAPAPGDADAVKCSLAPFPGRRYTLSVEVAFERDGLPVGADGLPIVEAKLPLVVRAKDGVGTSLAEVAGWLDPSEPPNVLFGQSAPASTRGSTSELTVGRLVGPFGAASTSPIAIEVNLGADRVGRARILSRRLVIHDDALPGAIRSALLVAAGGAVSLLTGVFALVFGWFRRRAGPRRKAA